MGGADQRQRQQRNRNAGRPRIDEDRHRGGDFSAGKPVGDHLCHLHIEQHAAGAADQPSCDLHGPRIRQRHREAAGQHQRERGEHRPLVAEPLPDRAARQRERNARREIQADQDSDVGEADAKLRAQQRRDRGDALKLEGHGEANHEQDGKDKPAIAQTLSLQGISRRNLRCGEAAVNRGVAVRRRGAHVATRPESADERDRDEDGQVRHRASAGIGGVIGAQMPGFITARPR